MGGERGGSGYWRRIERFGFGEEYWYERIARFFATFQMDYAERRGKHRWADKTPTYVFALPLIDRLFPDCQILHVIRNGLDVVASHLDRWGYRSALESIRTWKHAVKTGREFGARLPAERYREVRYESLVLDTERMLREVLEFLGEPWDPVVLDYDRVEHDQGDGHAELTESRRREGGDSAVVYASRVGAGRRRLDPFLRLMFRLRAGNLQKSL